LERQIEAQKTEVAQLTRLQNRLSGAIAETKANLAEINADLGQVRASIVQMIAQIEEVKARYQALVAELAALDAQLLELETEETIKRQELRERKALLADRLRAAYDTDRVSLLETFLSGGSFADLLSEVSYHLDVGAQDRALADRIKKDQETLAALHATVEATRKQTNLLRQETAVHKKALDRQLLELEAAQERLKQLEAETAQLLSEQKTDYARLAANKEALEASIKKTRAAKSALSREIREIIRKQEQAGNIPSKYNGTLKWPMVGRISGEFGCSTYPGYAPGNGCDHFHNGIDIVNPCGTPFHAAGAGVVVYIGWNYADGFDPAWVVVVAHSAGLQTWYAHGSPSYPGGIGVGSQVKAGQVIGYEASTGNSTGCHLHWMVDLNGRFVNPRLFL
ncbi:MAG TPA: peptidoglycan DD-metalloendopeptidase family protein, partial [Vitreimonas sp.]|nr:peptidoglycan DD-metalloendopeptidase family protein [Vitreimonas sp.]